MSDTLQGKVNSLTKSTDVNMKLVSKCRNLQENVGSDFGSSAMIPSTRICTNSAYIIEYLYNQTTLM